MTPQTHIASNVLYATILAALPVPPRQFLGWTRLERLPFLAHLLGQPQWKRHPFCLKHFGRLLQLPFLRQPFLQIPEGLVSFDEPMESPVVPLLRGLAALKKYQLTRIQAGILMRQKTRKH